jgi:hypothetical protein
LIPALVIWICCGASLSGHRFRWLVPVLLVSSVFAVLRSIYLMIQQRRAEQEWKRKKLEIDGRLRAFGLLLAERDPTGRVWRRSSDERGRSI